MSHLRIRLQLDGVRLEYSGTQEFFDRVMDPFVGAVASRARAAPPAASRAAAPGGTPAAADPSPPNRPAPEAEGERERAGERDTADADGAPGYRPNSADFGHFIRQLGEEAAEPDRQVVAFAFFLWNYEKREEFTEEEVAGCFRALGLPVPADLGELHQDLAARRRFLDPGREPGRWSLTQKGLNYVKTRLFVHV